MRTRKKPRWVMPRGSWPILALVATLAHQAPAQGMFSVPVLTELVPSGAGTEPSGGALAGDFTGDGVLDVVCGCGGNPGLPAALYMFPGDGQGGFQAPLQSPIFEFPVPLDSADLDGDGDLDLVVISASGFRPAFNQGNGTFQEGLLIAGIPGLSAGVQKAQYALRDLDANGSMEVVAAGPLGPWPYTSFGIKVYSYLGGSFYESYSTPTSAMGVWPIATGDFNGDGLTDIALASTTGPFIPSSSLREDIWVLVHQSPLTFSLLGPFPIPLPASSSPTHLIDAWWLRAADINGDGIEDLLVTAAIASTQSAVGSVGVVFPGHPTTVLAAPVIGGPVSFYYEPTLADFDLDGQVDLFVASKIPGQAIVTRVPPPTATSGWQIVPDGAGSSYYELAEAVGDMDGDGDPDVVCVMPSQPSGASVLPGLFIGTALNQSIRHAACQGPGSPPAPAFEIGTPAPGNPGFFLRISSAPPGAPVALGLSLGEGQLSSGACTIWLDLSPASLLLPSGPMGLMTTNASGLASLPIPIPNAANLVGQSLFGQWIALDPLGSFWLGGQSFSLTASRKIVIW